ncbi:iron ABC transporter permease [Natrialba hulunbeirensis JCM 10989]|uniref:Iron ABC transporter permease n=1 Tax=Natrialba hulunbeirensis JCM 10989 TaxID=1227493 RepID=L9ZW79_9EURY|nr:iron ABC transporter permease [Natrialba hulunbeirensis]ELY90579.1 iron ABC transporter permease [Natrialba hulunbeirensis JCM 10989]
MASNRLQKLFDAAGQNSLSWLLVLSGLIALLVASPLLWIGQRAAQVEPARGFELMVSARTAEILVTSLGLMASVTILSMLIGVPLAIVTTRTDLPYRRFWTVVAALPLVIPSYIGAFAFVSAFGEHGELESVLGMAMPNIQGFWGTVLIITLYTYPYVFLTTRAALLSMDASLVDAARTLNADRFEAFRRVTFPQIRPAIAAGSLLVALYAISDFGTPAFMQTEVFTSAIYWEYGAINVEYAALLSLQLLAVTGLVLLLEARVGRDEDASSGDSRGSQIRLGTWKWPTMGGIASLGIVTIVVPVAIFGVWLLRGTGGATTAYAFELEYALNSMVLAVLAALVACAFALPVGYLSARSDSLLARLFERVTYVGFAVPGIVIGLALVFFGSSYLSFIYRESIVLLVFAYVVRFLPQAVGNIRTSVLQVDDQLQEAAKTLNASRGETFRRVTLPLIAPGVVAGGVLVFLTTMKELPATLMLQPIGMETLVTLIWGAHGTAHYRYAALPALILVLISGLSMIILLRQEDSDLQ